MLLPAAAEKVDQRIEYVDLVSAWRCGAAKTVYRKDRAQQSIESAAVYLNQLTAAFWTRVWRRGCILSAPGLGGQRMGPHGLSSKKMLVV
jgi:hypothetical protein